MIRKLLLASLLTFSGIWALPAQTEVTVFGQVTNDEGNPQGNVNIIVSAFFADSTAFYESLYTDSTGTYETTIPISDPNILGFVQVDMVDCDNTIQTLFFTIINGVTELEANFDWCPQNNMDSCIVIIIEENIPGTTTPSLTAWTPPNSQATYLWSTGETTQTIIPAESGTYCVTVELDPLGCSVTDCYTINIDSSSYCWAFIVSTPTGNNTYDLEVIPTGGVAPFTFEWDNGNAGQILYDVGPGTYCVLMTDSIGCTFATCIVVNDVNFCEVYISEDPNGGLTAYGFGMPPISYVWSTGDTSQTIFPQVEGLYCVTATDANGCEATSCYDYWNWQDSCFVFIVAFMQDSNTLALQAIPNGFGTTFTYEWSTGETTEIIYPMDPFQNYCVTVTDNNGCVATNCYQPNNWCYTWIDLQYIDTATAVLTALYDPIFNWPPGTPPSFLWSNGETGQSISVDSSGEYCVTVALGTGCTATACVYVDFESLDSLCSAYIIQYPDSNGMQWLAHAYTWGWGTFTYEWSTGDTTEVIVLSDPNQYVCVTVTSSLGCESVACTDTMFNPCKVYISTTYDPTGFATLTAYAYNNPNQNATYVWNTGESGQTITVTEEGTYCVTVTGGGCVGEACVYVDFFNTDTCGVWIQLLKDTAGTVFSALPWGTPPFTYLWDNGATEQIIFDEFGVTDHCVTMTDANGCVATACAAPFDSCYAEIYLTYLPQPQLQIFSWDPIAFIQWSTNDPGDTMMWLNITEPGTYCATYMTFWGCTGNACIIVDTLFNNPGVNVINGFVFGDTLQSLSGRVVAYAITNEPGQFEQKGSSPIDDQGFYNITGLDPGMYLVQAVLDPNTNGGQLYLPTYHLSTTDWEKADPHVLPNMLPVTTDIYLVRKLGLNGSGVIAGTITDPHQIVTNESEHRDGGGLVNVIILLHNEQGMPMDYDVTLDGGLFRFDNLPFGTYRLKFDIAGIPSPDFWVTLTPEDPEKLQVNIIVETGSVSTDQPKAEEIKLYPNPVRYAINTVVPGHDHTYDIQVIDLQGKVIYAGSGKNYEGILTIDVSAYPSGMYQIHIVNDNRLYYGNFVKME